MTIIQIYNDIVIEKTQEYIKLIYFFTIVTMSYLCDDVIIEILSFCDLLIIENFIIAHRKIVVRYLIEISEKHEILSIAVKKKLHRNCQNFDKK